MEAPTAACQRSMPFRSGSSAALGASSGTPSGGDGYDGHHRGRVGEACEEEPVVAQRVRVARSEGEKGGMRACVHIFVVSVGNWRSLVGTAGSSTLTPMFVPTTCWVLIEGFILSELRQSALIIDHSHMRGLRRFVASVCHAVVPIDRGQMTTSQPASY